MLVDRASSILIENIYQASQMAGIASKTHTFHKIAVLVRRAS